MSDAVQFIRSGNGLRLTARQEVVRRTANLEVRICTGIRRKRILSRFPENHEFGLEGRDPLGLQ